MKKRRGMEEQEVEDNNPVLVNHFSSVIAVSGCAIASANINNSWMDYTKGRPNLVSAD